MIETWVKRRREQGRVTAHQPRSLRSPVAGDRGFLFAGCRVSEDKERAWEDFLDLIEDLLFAEWEARMFDRSGSETAQDSGGSHATGTSNAHQSDRSKDQ